jgi:hypothetical protein
LHLQTKEDQQKKNKEITDALEAQKQVSASTAKEVQRVRSDMQLYIANELPSALAAAIQAHFLANPPSSFPAPHEQPAWISSIRDTVKDMIPPPAPVDIQAISASLGAELRKELTKEMQAWRADLSAWKDAGDKKLTDRMNAIEFRIASIRSEEGRRPGLTEEQVQERIKAALEAQRPPPMQGLSEAQIMERIEAALTLQREQWDARQAEAGRAPPREIVVHNERRQATEPWIYSADRKQDVRTWILACDDFFQRNPTQWVLDRDRIIYAISRMEHGSRAHDFGSYYRRTMDGIDGIPRVDTARYWTTFVSELKERFLSSEEAAEALISIQKLIFILFILLASRRLMA